ncbi:peptide/nickel transport system ATP-binding protein [Labedella gwakjiensis]|uniref:ABC transporter ATP-binding protein n=1 Tax=Labedella gwakjiensis TaxID=390269 RepID=A0A2P8GST4_9MICO|nr:ATP-binding cassette domain-containing protein [Labedella gwakjiensis]PSL37014.1 peptide/nickel transport system ATP-binding protein [Labedella gwakjiensis]RUQ81829.1 ABC transporter ATP-binding protein [Labedella gwakjiensis]
MSTLELRDVTKEYRLRGGFRGRTLTAVSHVDFTIESGRTTALVGQSGSGKSTIAKLLMQLERPTSGQVLFDGTPVGRHGAALRSYRSDVQMVFQDPFASLNPYHSVRHHLERPLRLHGKATTRDDLDTRVTSLLERVRLDPEMADRRPHELSGGQRQRIAIARALAPEPKILVADEPVSMLDVSIRLGVLNLLADLQNEEDLGVLYITHDLATARHFSDDILVMYRGEIVERGPADEVILNPQHEYTRLLAEAAPDPEKRIHA